MTRGSAQNCSAGTPGRAPLATHSQDRSRRGREPSASQDRAGARARRLGLLLAVVCSLLASPPQSATAESGSSKSPVSATNPALTAGLRGNQDFGGGCNVPTDGAKSPLFGAQPFSQQMLRFEELGSKPLAQPVDEDTLAGSCCPSRSSVHGGSNAEPCETCPLKLPSPHDEYGNDCATCTVDGAELDALLQQYIHPYPAPESTSEGIYQSRTNDWEECIENTHTGPLSPMEPGGISSYSDGRPEGPQYGHQRWEEFFPPVYSETVVAGARTNTGLRDSAQQHGYRSGEFAPDGLYHNTTGNAGFAGTTAGIEVKFHPAMPVQDHQTLWTFDGTLPPKLLSARYGQGVLFRNHNALPIRFDANRGFGNHFISTHEHNGHNPAESDGYAQAFFLPGQHYDYHWPMVLAGHDPLERALSNNPNATEAKASSPCEAGESMVVSYPSPLRDGSGQACTRAQKLQENVTRGYAGSDYQDSTACGWRRVENTCPAAGRINIPGDWRETMSTHWFHDHMLDYTAQNTYKGNAAMFNMYSALDRGNECLEDEVNLRLPSGCAQGTHSWGNRDYDVNLLLASKAWGQDTERYEGTEVEDTRGQLWFATFNTDGFLGDRMTVNWLWNPYLDVRARRYRFRILNGDVSRFFRIALVVKRNDGGGEFSGDSTNVSYDRVPFHMVANDGNILEHAVPFDGSMDLDRDGNSQDHYGMLPTLSIAERYDIVVDFSTKNSSGLKPGDKLYMVNLLEHQNGKKPNQLVSLSEILSGKYENDGNCDSSVGPFLELRVHSYASEDPSMNPSEYVPGKKKMIPLPVITEQQLANAHHRNFDFGKLVATDKQPVTITPVASTGPHTGPAPNRVGSFEAEAGGESVNLDEEEQLPVRPDKLWGIESDAGREGMLTMDPRRVSAAPTLGDLEVWHLEGNGGWSHNIHIHFEEGRILTRDGKAPPEWEKWARKDIFRVGPMDDSGNDVTLAIRFREFAGTFMEHCHNTQHEDHSMLMRWDIENPGQLKPFLTPEPHWNGCSYTESYELPTASSNRSPVVGDPKAKQNFYEDFSVAELLATGDHVDSSGPEAIAQQDPNHETSDPAATAADTHAHATTAPSPVAAALKDRSPPHTRLSLRAHRNALRKAQRDARAAKRSLRTRATVGIARSVRRTRPAETAATESPSSASRDRPAEKPTPAISARADRAKSRAKMRLERVNERAKRTSDRKQSRAGRFRRR